MKTTFLLFALCLAASASSFAASANQPAPSAPSTPVQTCQPNGPYGCPGGATPGQVAGAGAGGR